MTVEWLLRMLSRPFGKTYLLNIAFKLLFEIIRNMFQSVLYLVSALFLNFTLVVFVLLRCKVEIYSKVQILEQMNL